MHTVARCSERTNILGGRVCGNTEVKERKKARRRILVDNVDDQLLSSSSFSSRSWIIRRLPAPPLQLAR